MSEIFKNSKNKATLWNILYEQGVFQNLDQHDHQQVKNMFDEIINNFVPSASSTLVNSNKEILSIVINKIIKYSAQKSTPTALIPPAATPNTNNGPDIPMLNMITAKDITNERLRAFEHGVQLKEQEMQSIMKLKKPEDINFKDDVEDAPMEMDKSLQSMIERRRTDFNQVIGNTDITKAQEWINKELPPSPDESQPKHVTFEVTDTDVTTDVITDVTTDVITDVTTPDFLKKLKKSTNIGDNNEDIIRKLDLLLYQQQQMTEELSKISASLLTSPTV